MTVENGDFIKTSEGRECLIVLILTLSEKDVG
jgi:hypothetical protein